MFHRTSHPCRKLVKRCLGRIIRDMDSIVHTETGLWFGQTGVQIPAGERDFLLNVHTSSGAHPAACSVGSFPSAKQPGCDIDYWPPSNAEVYNEWSCTCPPPNIPSCCGQGQLYFASHILTNCNTWVIFISFTQTVIWTRIFQVCLPVSGS